MAVSRACCLRQSEAEFRLLALSSAGGSHPHIKRVDTYRYRYHLFKKTRLKSHWNSNDFFVLLQNEFSGSFDANLIGKRTQRLIGVFQFLNDVNVLRAVAFALAAGSAGIGE